MPDAWRQRLDLYFGDYRAALKGSAANARRLGGLELPADDENAQRIRANLLRFTLGTAAMAALRLGRDAEAESALRERLTLPPNPFSGADPQDEVSRSQVMLAHAVTRQGRSAEAREILQPALQRYRAAQSKAPAASRSSVISPMPFMPTQSRRTATARAGSNGKLAGRGRETAVEPAGGGAGRSGTYAWWPTWSTPPGAVDEPAEQGRCLTEHRSRATRGNDYTPEMAGAGASSCARAPAPRSSTSGSSSFDPAVLPGNIENFIGVAQVPIGLAGPLRINGEHAQGEFYVPLATTEGTLVASYNRGMRLLTECGGVKTTVVERSMQRAPVFMFDDAREAREFGEWLDAALRRRSRPAAETTTRSGKLVDIEQYADRQRCCYLRFNYTTGDAAGQNMTGKATLAACEWIHATYPGARRVHAVGQHRHRQEALADQHAAHARQARGRRGRDPERRAASA